MRILILGTAGEGKSTIAKIIDQALKAHDIQADVVDESDYTTCVAYDYPTRIKSIIERDPIITIEPMNTTRSTSM